MTPNTQNHDNITSKVTLDNRNRFAVTRVTKAISANENTISLLVGKTTMYITGSMLHVSKLDITTGMLEGDGWVDSIRYNKSGNIFRKLTIIIIIDFL